MKKRLVQCLLFFFLPFCWAQTNTGNPSAEDSLNPMSKPKENPDLMVIQSIPKVEVAPNVCEPPSNAIKSWMDQSMIQLEAQKMRKKPINDLQEQYSKVWFYFRSLRNNKWNMDEYSQKMIYLYDWIYPSIQRPPLNVFQQTKEAVLICKK